MMRGRERSWRLGLAAGLAAASLGPLAAVAAAGGSASGGGSAGAPAPADSGGGGLSTTSAGSTTVATGTTTVVSVSTTTANGTTTVGACSQPVFGTVTETVPTTTTSVPGLTVTTGCSTPPPPTLPSSTLTTRGGHPAPNPFAKRGMWIWELPATDGGNVNAIIAEARRRGIDTVYVKSGDGTGVWSQFTPALVRAFHAGGLRVCAWQYVYGNQPTAEAQVGVASVRDGADCLVIDAEAEYAGRYVQAQQYLGALRARIGSRFPLALAGLPYVDYHPTFPYSVFLGPNGAQVNLPQMYWQDIGTTVPAVYAHTFAFNELYQRPIDPLGQLYNAPPATSVKLFRSIGFAYRATGVSWWDWQSAGTGQFDAIAAPVGPPAKGFTPQTTVAALAAGAVGDPVVLAQEHLWNTHERVTIDGGYGRQTAAAIATFQSMHGLTATGILDPVTWNALLRVPLPRVHWVVRHRRVVAVVSGS